MRLRFLSIVVVIHFSLACYSQSTPSKAQIEEMKKQLQLMMNGGKIDRNALEKMKNQLNEKKPSASRNNAVLLSSIPNHPFTRQQLITYLQNLENAALKNRPLVASDAKSLMAGSTPEQVESKAVMAWYSSAPETAIYMSVHLGVQHPERMLNLNNLGAMLNLYGSPEKAIPILKTVLNNVPKNSMVLNNLGQAYAGLDAKDTALYYLGACMSVAPHHPEACTTAGKIEESKGNTQKAIEDYRNALKGALSEEAANRLEKLAPNDNLANYIAPRFDFPYFNMYKYPLLPQITNVDSTESMLNEYATYRKMLFNLTSNYGQLEKEEEEKAIPKLKAMSAANRDNGIFTFENPFMNLAGRMMVSVNFKTSAEWAEAKRKADNLKYQLDTLNENFEIRSKKFSGDCKAIDQFNNQYLKEAAELMQEWQKVQLRAIRSRFNQFIYWQYMASAVEEQAHAAYYQDVVNYLQLFDGLCQTYYKYPCQQWGSTHAGERKDSTEKAPDCPINIEIPIVIGKIKLTCSQFVISGGEGLRFKYKKNFNSGQSTMSVGAGLGFDVGKNFDGLNIKGSVKAEENFYVCFNGENQFQDAGFSFEANASGSIDLKVDGVPKTLNIASVDAKDGYSIGINSGITFNDFDHSAKTFLDNSTTTKSSKSH